MLITHGDFQIEIGLAQHTLDGRFTVAWAVYGTSRRAGAGPLEAGTTIAFSDAETAVTVAMAQGRDSANGFA